MSTSDGSNVSTVMSANNCKVKLYSVPRGVLREVIAQQGAKQPGVHVGTEAFPLGRPV